MSCMKILISVLMCLSSARWYSLAGRLIPKAFSIGFRSGSSPSMNRYRSPGRGSTFHLFNAVWILRAFRPLLQYTPGSMATPPLYRMRFCIIRIMIRAIIQIRRCAVTCSRVFTNRPGLQIAFHETELVFDLGRAMIKARRTLQSREIFYLVLFSKWQTRMGIIPSTNVVYSLSRLYY